MILIVSTFYMSCISWIIKCLNNVPVSSLELLNNAAQIARNIHRSAIYKNVQSGKQVRNEEAVSACSTY